MTDTAHQQRQRPAGIPVEIERKFLVVGDEWRSAAPGERYCQGYIKTRDAVTVRVRRCGEHAAITIKGPAEGLVRPEFEYDIPVLDAEAMLQDLCARPLIEKIRFKLIHAGQVSVVDEFAGQNAGLVLAEVELDDPRQEVILPAWVGAEVTHDERYRNSRLADVPIDRRMPEKCEV